MSPLAQDLSGLPKEGHDRQGCPPDPEPRFVHLLVTDWMEAETERKPRAFADSRFRHSDAGKCSRAIAYAALDLEPSDPMDLSGFWNTGLGTVIHEQWQDSIRRRYPDADIEPKVRTDAGSGHIDAVIVDGDRKIAVELKSIGGFGFKMAVGERGQAEGPKHEHLIQAALNGLAVDADEIVIAYLSKEAISVQAAQRKKISETGRFCAEWSFSREEFEPIARAEIERITSILSLLDEGLLPARKIPSPDVPKGGVIVDPTTGRWEVRSDAGIEDTGTYWMCGYCAYQSLCSQTGSGRIPVADVADITAVAS